MTSALRTVPPPRSPLRQALDAAPVVVWAIDTAGTFTLSEGRGLELLGMKAGEAVGLSALDMFRDNPTIAGAFVRALSGEDTLALTCPAPGLAFRSWYSALRGLDGQISGASCVSFDVSDELRGERAGSAEQPAPEPARRTPTTPIIQVWDGVLCLP
ncbi:MAG: hypothetical protein ACRENE_06150, partial [Polyangiaceae bacterium]